MKIADIFHNLADFRGAPGRSVDVEFVSPKKMDENFGFT